jgi:hypothetical protein
MNTDHLIQDACLMLETIEQCHSPAFKAAAARQLVDIVVDIAAQLQAAVSVAEEPKHPTLKESVEKFHEALTAEPADDRPVIDLAMKYRTRDGRDVTRLSKYDGATYSYHGLVDGCLRTWTKHGRWHAGINPNELDLIPTGEPA